MILLDIGLPKLDGHQACGRIRAQPRGARVAIIAVTGWGQENDRTRSEQTGFDAHMVKPVDPETLLALVDDLCDSKSSVPGTHGHPPAIGRH